MALTTGRFLASLALVAILIAGCSAPASSSPATQIQPKPCGCTGAPRQTTQSANPAPSSAASNAIPQHNGGDHDADNNGGPSDGDGNI